MAIVLVASHSPRNLGFHHRPVNAAFAVDKMAPLQIILRVLRFSTVSNTPPLLPVYISFIYHGRHIILTIENVVKQDTSFSLSTKFRKWENVWVHTAKGQVAYKVSENVADK
jgi:hypothetical protein